MSAALQALRARAGSRGAVRILTGTDETLALADVVRQVDGIAEDLLATGVRVLAIAADNSPDWALVDLAAQAAGITTVPLPPFFSTEQIVHVLGDSGADAIAADESGSVPLLSLPTRFARELTPTLALLRLDTLNEDVPLPRDTAKISYTSGTTGTPKGICLRQETMDAVAESLASVTRDIGIRRHLCLLPLATLLENIAGIHAPLIAGAEIALPGLDEVGLRGATGLDIGQFVRCIGRYQPDSLILVPQLLAALVGAVERGATLPASLKFVAVGGGVVGRTLLERAGRSGIPVYEGYGLTECASVVALNTPAARRVGSVGRPLPHCSVRIAADGEVFVAGAMLAGRLGDRAEPTPEFATGDLGRLDAEGFLHIEGRKKNVLITSFGRNLSPDWVESELNATGPIAQAALFGDGRPFNVAVVVPARDAPAREIERAIERVNRRLPDYARVSRWILAAEPFSPANGALTANGRLRRDAIAARHARAIESCYAGGGESNA